MREELKPWLRHYDEGVPAEIDLPEISLVEVFRSAVRQYGEGTCLICKDVSMTYIEVDDLSDRVARFLVAQGLGKGDRVGLFLPNSAEFVISYYGILKAGGVVMAINPAFRSAEVKKLATESGIRFLFLSLKGYQEALSIRSETEIERMILIGEPAEEIADNDLTWEKLRSEYDTGNAIQVDVGPDDPAVFQYSGGTTGTPKCAIGLHRNLVANVIQFNHWLVNTLPGKETILVAIPLYHVYGMVLGMNLAVWMGARMVLIPDPRDMVGLLEAIQYYKVTVFPGVPNLYAGINRYPSVLEDRYDLSSIKACISGSTTLPLQVKQAFEALSQGHLVEGYGLSEAPTATHCNPILGENRSGSIGLPLPGVDCRIVDLETGNRVLGVNEVGELIIRGPQVMAGYHKQPEETDLALRDGWLFTGDVARMDSEGYFYLVDRKKDVIKVAGFQVWPNEIEVVLMKHPKVREVAVAGVLDEDGAEAAKAWIVVKAGEVLDKEELFAFCGADLTRYKIPKYIEFRESLPRTTVGKVLRRVLVEQHQVD